MIDESNRETIRRIHVKEGAMEVGEYADVPEMIEIRPANKVSAEYFGEFRLQMMPGFARLLGEALIQAADEKDAK